VYAYLQTDLQLLSERISLLSVSARAKHAFFRRFRLLPSQAGMPGRQTRPHGESPSLASVTGQGLFWASPVQQALPLQVQTAGRRGCAEIL